MGERSISAKTELVGLIGWPIGHSVSPAMHNAALAELGLDWRYVGLPVDVEPAGRIEDAVRGLRALGFRGSNVTVPHKQGVMPYLDHLTPAAAAIGAVNTIQVLDDGTLIGDNTDARGFIADLVDHGIEPAGLRALILGAGGSARAIVFGLAEAGAADITVLNRTPAKAQALVDDMRTAFPTCPIVAGSLPADLHAATDRAALFVNCTSLGMSPQVDGLPWDETVPLHANQIVYDLVYNPWQTRFLEMAERAGARAIGGFGMLVWQGALALEQWTGLPAPVDTMKQAGLDALLLMQSD
jgi:shikimate dehydrogenase